MEGHAALNFRLDHAQQYLVLKKALETGKVRHVLWGLDYNSFACNPEEVRQDNGSFPLYLYEETATTPLSYLLSQDVFAFSWRALLGRGNPLETLHAWSDRYEFSEAPVLAAWTYQRELSIQNPKTLAAPLRCSPQEALAANVRMHLASLVQARPDVVRT